uniref:Uncharacterized protein n=1 Tax=Catharus ustulatus TaxID=91951 RepID=A0A8C3UB31_CATUS
MRTISKDSLKTSLLQLECHFTWDLHKEDVGLEALEETILDHIKFVKECNITDYNILSYVCHLKNSNEEGLRNLQKAEEAIQEHHPGEIARRSLVTWGNYAWIYYHMQRYEEAQTYVSKVENSCKKLSGTALGKIQLPEVCAEQGWALLRFGRSNFEKARNCFENALKSEPDNPDFNAGYAIAMFRLESFARWNSLEMRRCLEALKRAVELNPNDTTLLALLALHLQGLKRPYSQKSESKAIEYYIEGLKMEKDSYGRKQCSEAVEKLLKQKIESGLGHATEFGTLGLVHKLNGKKQEAIECYQKAIALDPNNEEYLNALAELQLSISNSQKFFCYLLFTCNSTL